MQGPVSEENYRTFLTTFQLFHEPSALAESTLLTSPLIEQVQQRQPELLPHQALQTVFTEILALLAAENRPYADLLQGRFWEGQQIEAMVAAERPLPISKRTFSSYQRSAILAFAFLFLQAESNQQRQPSAQVTGQPALTTKERETEEPLRQPVPRDVPESTPMPMAVPQRIKGYVWRALWLLPVLLVLGFLGRTLFVGVTPEATAQTTEILFEDDFEKGDTQWNPDSAAWTIQEDGQGNHFYCVKTNGAYTNALAGSTTWRDYTLKLDLNIVQSAPHGSGNILWRVKENVFPLYLLDFFAKEDGGGVALAREAPDYATLDQTLGRLPMGRWTTLRIEVHGAQMKVFGEESAVPILQATDADPIPQGGIGLGAGFSQVTPTAYWEICFDNVRVTQP